MAGPRFVPNNQITLLENGETYFPVMEAALDRAEHEIYLISYIFKMMPPADVLQKRSGGQHCAV